MKKIACVIPYTYLPVSSGGQKLIAGFYEHLGEVVELYAFGTPENNPALVKNYTLFPMLNSSRWRYLDLSLFFKLKKTITKHKIETLIIEHPYFGWLGWMLKLACNIQLIYHTHNVEHQRFKSVGKKWWWFLKMYEGWSLRKADYVFCITEEDKKGMIEELHISPSKCVLVPYGINQKTIPANKKDTKESVCKDLQINPSTFLLFFNGVLSYKPNIEALDVLLYKITPLLVAHKFNYKLLIAGKNLPESYQQLKNQEDKHIIYLGFVADIDRYTLAADVLLNPVVSGGGVKTKMIEALGLNTTVVSTITGSAGVNTTICGEMLKIVENDNWEKFAEEIINATATSSKNIPEAFYEQFSWKKIIQKLLPLLGR